MGEPCHVGVSVPYYWVIRPLRAGYRHWSTLLREGACPARGPISFEEMGERRPGERVSFPLDPQTLVWGVLKGISFYELSGLRPPHW